MASRKRKSELERSGAQSVASQALHDEYDRMNAGQEPTPVGELADVLIAVQKELVASRQEQGRLNALLFEAIQNQEAAFRESMSQMQKQFIQMRERDRAQFQSALAEAHERSEHADPRRQEEAIARAAQDIHKRTVQLRSVMTSEARIIAEELEAQPQVMWHFDQPTTIRISSWVHRYPSGMQPIPQAVYEQLVGGIRERQKLDRMKDILSQTPKLGGDPNAIYALERRVDQLTPRLT